MRPFCSVKRPLQNGIVAAGGRKMQEFSVRYIFIIMNFSIIFTVIETCSIFQDCSLFICRHHSIILILYCYCTVGCLSVACGCGNGCCTGCYASYYTMPSSDFAIGVIVKLSKLLAPVALI